jgi:hypothetical protein
MNSLQRIPLCVLLLLVVSPCCSDIRQRSARVRLELRGGMEMYPYSEQSLSASGSDSGAYWYENFEMPKVLPPGVLTGPRNLSDVIGSLQQRVDGQKVFDGGIDSAHTHPYIYREDYENLPPSHTLYVRNLRESVHPLRMRALLYAVFSKYGRIIYVRAIRTKTMRGQAFICYKELEDAVSARNELDGFSFLNRTMVIQFAKAKSYALMKLDGTFDSVLRTIRDEFLAKEAEALKATATSLLMPATPPEPHASGAGNLSLVQTSRSATRVRATAAAEADSSMHWRLISSGAYLPCPLFFTIRKCLG